MTRAVVVGSGPNGLAAGVTLAAAGVDVTVLEAADRIGGGTRTSELTLPGLLHDECSAAHPLAVDTAFTERFDLAAHGLRWRWADVEYSHPLDGGRGAAAVRSVDETADGLGADGRAWRSIFGWITDHFDLIAPAVTQPMTKLPRHPLAMARFGAQAGLPASLLLRRLRTVEGRALLSGTMAHALRPHDALFSAAIGVTLGTAAHRYGWPVAEGGSRAITDAMASLLRQHGGRIETGVEVTDIAELDDPDVVMFDTSPEGAARIAGDRLPGRVSRALRRYRHGPATFKVEFAVRGGIPWTHEASRRAGTVHVSGDAHEIAVVERQVARGVMPERPFVLLCQQYLADPTRSNGDLHPIYAYAHVPTGWDGDATAAIEAQIERYAPGFRDRIEGRDVRTVAQTVAYNRNFVGGDTITGANDWRQMVARPRPAIDPYALGAPGLFICSAATPPGAGAHGMCGFNAAQSALRRLNA